VVILWFEDIAIPAQFLLPESPAFLLRCFDELLLVCLLHGSSDENNILFRQ
jgi:hypothetical protein